jgi:hypothetical protein
MTFIDVIGWLLIGVGLWAAWRMIRYNAGALIWLALLSLAGVILILFFPSSLRVN